MKTEILLASNITPGGGGAGTSLEEANGMCHKTGLTKMGSHFQ